MDTTVNSATIEKTSSAAALRRFFGHLLKRRTAEIEQAKRAAKQRDEVCLVCGSVDPWGKCWGPLDGAHLIPINSPFRNWDPADPENIFPLHRSVHSTPGNGSYDENKTLESRRAWIMKRVRKREHRERLIARLEYVYGERESPAA